MNYLLSSIQNKNQYCTGIVTWIYARVSRYLDRQKPFLGRWQQALKQGYFSCVSCRTKSIIWEQEQSFTNFYSASGETVG